MLRHGLGSETVPLKCDDGPAILALAQEIRRLRREHSITILDHPEEGEKQSNHHAGEGPRQNSEEQHGVESEDCDRPVSSADTLDH